MTECRLCGDHLREVADHHIDEYVWVDSRHRTTGRDLDLRDLPMEPYAYLSWLGQQCTSGRALDLRVAREYSSLKVRLDSGMSFHQHRPGQVQPSRVRPPHHCRWPMWMRPSGWHCRQCPYWIGKRDWKVTTKHLHIMGIDPGHTTGWTRLTVPRYSIFGDEYPEITEWDYGEFTGPLARQAVEIARLARETQGLDYKTGVALVCEAWDQDPKFKSTDPETLSPVRIGAQLELLREQGLLGDSTLHFQSRTLIHATAVSDERLKKLGMYVPGSDHIRDSTKHAIIGLRRAAEDPFTFGLALWPYPPNGIA